jgi:Rap guanine nucleotide exchange factor 4
LSAVIFRVYCADHTFCTLRFPIYTTAEVIKMCAADKLQITASRGPDDLVLVEVKSNGERTVFRDNDLSIPTTISLCGRIFVSPKDHLDALTPLPEQEGATDGIEMDVEALATKDLAYHMTLFDWDLFWAVHEYELIYHTFGRYHFNKVRHFFVITGKLNFRSQFNPSPGNCRHKRKKIFHCTFIFV